MFKTILFYHLRKPQESVFLKIYIATELFFPIDLSFDTVLLESLFDYLVSSLMDQNFATKNSTM